MNIVKSAFGLYEPKGRLDDADLVIGHSFGTVISENSVNRQLAECIIEHADGRPIVVDRMLADAFPAGETQPDYIVGGPISTSTGGGVGSWGTLVEAKKEFMLERELTLPLMVAQKYHIGRVAMQWEKLGMDAVIPPDLPGRFDPESKQFWTRGLNQWVFREIIGSLALRADGKL